MKEAVENLLKALVDKPDEVIVSEKPSDRSVMIVVQVANSDMGKLIGREGRTVKAIRSMLYAASQKHGKRFVLEIVE
ncbi:MAG: KH domain-containing protein [Pyrinomonadaceae bacterium]|jgi:uncharacterized protein|nr:KH domain-containing protein [Pyrinomonadaceae bacterium]